MAASPAPATSSALQPTKRVNATSEARSRAVGRSSASSRRSHSWAGSVAKTDPAPPMTAGTPTANKASRTSVACELARTSTAMSPGSSGARQASVPSRRVETSSG